MNQNKPNQNRMRNYLPYITVVLFSLWPYVNFTYANIFESLSYFRLFLIACGFLITTMVVFKIFEKLLFRGNAKSAAAYVGMLIVCFFSYDAISLAAHSLFGEYQLRSWATVAVITLIAGFFFSKTNLAKTAAPVVGFAMLAVPAAQIALALSEDVEQWPENAVGSAVEGSNAGPGQAVNRRSVYYLMTDGYPRDDVLAQLGHDNEPFLKELQERGFYVARDARANYESTLYTLASQFFLDYVITEEREVNVPTLTARMQGAQRGDNPVHEFFIENDYYTAILSSSARNCNPKIDFCATKWSNWFGLGQLEAKFFSLTPLIHVGNKLSFANEASYTPDLLRYIDEITAKKPVFLFAHIFDVHPPFTYKKDCVQSFEGKTNFFEYYFEPEFFYSVKCANANLLEIVDRIRSEDPDSIIIVAADHGSAFNLFVSGKYEVSTDPGTLYERFTSFAAWYVPEECRNLLYPGLSPVNTFRIVIPCLTGEKPQPHQDMTFFRVDHAEGTHTWKLLPVDLSRDRLPDVTRRLREKGLMPNK